MKKFRKTIMPVILLICAVMLCGCLDMGTKTAESEISDLYSPDGFIDLNSTSTKPSFPGKIVIEGIGEFGYNPEKIKSARDDIFNEGYFSIFDILVYLDSAGEIEMEYHFDRRMNTYVIDSINGEGNWWYFAYYDGGWKEENAFRIDHYPVKDRMHIELFKQSESRIDRIYESFREEIRRKEENGGKVIIPSFTVRGRSVDLAFENVEVSAHNFRSDVFRPGVITAIDVLASLQDEGKLDFDVRWYETIGTAQIVKSYYVERINEDAAFGRCGFVYESGSNDFKGFAGSHIHVQSDIRVINSPEYMEWFWICI